MFKNSSESASNLLEGVKILTMQTSREYLASWARVQVGRKSKKDPWRSFELS